MFKARIGIQLVTFALATVLPLQSNANVSEYSGRVMYKYTTMDGNTVMDFSLDAQAAKRGYTILTPSGRVIAVVPPELTEAERAKVELEKKQKKRDKFLLSRYSSVADVERARDREVGDLQSRVDALKGNMMAVKTNLEQYQAQAADRERRGQDPSKSQMKAISDLSNKIEVIKEDIKNKQKEVDSVRTQYEEDIERFHYIEEKYHALLERRRARTTRPQG